jgi:hypothetical protein
VLSRRSADRLELLLRVCVYIPCCLTCFLPSQFKLVILFASIALVASTIDTHTKTTQLADDAAIFTYPAQKSTSLQANTIGKSAKTTLFADDASIFTYPAQKASLRGRITADSALTQYACSPSFSLNGFDASGF